MKTVAFHTLGCKVTQYDSQAMLEAFERAGYLIKNFDEAADVYVVNTCTVTGTGDKKSMQAVRRAYKQNPLAEVIIAGCLAQRDGEALLQSGARLVLGNARRGEVVQLLEDAVSQNVRMAAVTDVLRVPYEPLYITRHEGHTRATLKIQEGCDRYCAYCIIPYVRGGIRSRPPADIRLEAQRLAEAGFRELVLTGIHLTSYGRDLSGETLLDAVKACDVPGIARIRLGSLEPVIATEAFVQALAAMPKVCPQFHLSLQSGSDTVLKRMRRRYSAEEFMNAASRLRHAFPLLALTTDVIAGFPGETDQEHQETLEFCKKLGFAKMHVFPYSARKGTAAAAMPGQVPKAVREQRAHELIALSETLSATYRAQLIGTRQAVLIEENQTGYTPQYIPCQVPDTKEGDLVNVTVTACTGEGVKGELT